MSRKVVDDWFDAFRTRDLSKLHLAENFVHSSPFGEIRGREAYLDLVRANPDAFFGNPITIVDVMGGDGKFAVRYLLADMDGCDCIYVKNGEITQIHAYYHYGDKPSF